MARKGATQQSSAPYNRRIVLDVIRRGHEVSRKEIIDQVGLSPQTVANITQDLETMGLVISKRVKGGGARGQPPMAFMLNPRGGDAIGISLEPHKISAGVVNLVGEVLARREVVNDARDRAATLELMVELVADLSAKSHDARTLWGVGVAMPGPFDAPNLSFVGPTAIEGWSDLSILTELEVRTGLDVFYNTDSVAAALGESLFGVAQDLDNYFYLHFGIGLGGALILEKAAYPGERGNATEIGHIPIQPGGAPCYCGSQGCLERYLSLHALSEAIIGDVGVELSNEQILRLLARDDERLAAWCQAAAGHLRNAVCVIENMLDPTTIVIGGSAPAALVRHIVDLTLPLLPSVRTGAPSGRSRITLSERQEDSLILGAAVLPIHEVAVSQLRDLALDAPRGPRRGGFPQADAVGAASD